MRVVLAQEADREVSLPGGLVGISKTHRLG